MAEWQRETIQAGRRLRTSPGFTIIVVLVLATGMAVATAAFGLMNTVLFRPPPVQDPASLVRVYAAAPQLGWARGYISPAVFARWDDNVKSASLAAYSERGFNVLRRDTPERVSGALVTWDFFRVLGLRPHSGRTFLPDDDRVGADRVAILSWQFWTEAMQSEPMEGRTLRIDGIPHVVVGVMPREVTFPAVADVWLPLNAMRLAEHDTRPMLVAVGRMYPGRTIAVVRDELAALIPAELAWSPNVLLFADGIDDGLGPILVLLFCAVLLVLLVACANVGNLLLARYSGRARELAIRSAIGASRIRLLRELLIEALLLSALATAGGLLLGSWLLELGFALVPPELQLPSWLQPELDWRVVVFATAMTLLTTTTASLGPALMASRAAAASLMSGAARGGEPLSAVRLRRRLIVAQVTFSVVLLVCAASLYRSVQALERADWGYVDPENVLLARVTLPEAAYPDAERATGVLRDALAGIASIAGVSAVSGHGDEERLRGVDGVLLESTNGQTLRASGNTFVKRLSIMPGYADAMSLTVQRGRDVAAADLPGSPPVALINESMARALGLAEDAVGSRLRVPELGAAGEALTIVGVIEDALEPQFGSTGARLAARPTIYLPLLQHPTRDLVVAIRTRSEPLRLTPHVRASVLSVDPAQPITQVMTLDRYLGFASAPMRWLAALFAVIGGVAFALAALGLYGVIAFTTRRRTREIGIRIAIGATRHDIITLVGRQSFRVIATGVLLGSVGAVGVNHLLRGMLYDVGPVDPSSYLLVAAAVFSVAILAALQPARRACQVDVNEAFRTD